MTAQPLADPSAGEEGPDRHDHPEPGQLEGFMRGEGSSAERRAIVRHLLAGCPHCRYITSRLWKLGQERRISIRALLHREMQSLWQRTPSRLSRRETAIAAVVKAAQEMLLEAAGELRQMKGRLEVMDAALPPSPQADPVIDDVLTELRCVIRSVIADRLLVAILELRAGASYPAEPPADEEPTPP